MHEITFLKRSSERIGRRPPIMPGILEDRICVSKKSIAGTIAQIDISLKH